MKGKEVIKYGKKVNKLYFLLKGEIIAYNKLNFPIFLLNESTIFGDWEFLNKSFSDLTYKVVGYKSAIGFSLDYKVFKSIAKDHVESVKHVFELSYKKKAVHLDWIYGNRLNCDQKNQHFKNENKNEEGNNEGMCKEIEDKLVLTDKNISSLEYALINLKNLLIDKTLDNN